MSFAPYLSRPRAPSPDKVPFNIFPGFRGIQWGIDFPYLIFVME